MTRSKDKSKEDIGKNFVTNELVTEESAVSEIPKDDDVEEAASKFFAEPPIKLMPTLPSTFKSLVGFPINITIENRKPKNMITLLGNALGISDYETNIASFWFLDFIALQVLRYESDVDDHDRSVMVSWLAGEMKLIRDNNLSHETFLHQIQDIFSKSYEKISRGQSLLHWDLIAKESKSEEIIVEEEITKEPKEPEVSIINMTKHRENSKSKHERIPSKVRSRNSVKSLERTRIEESKTTSDEENVTKPKVQSRGILDIVMEATYSMYGNSFHYALVIAAFVEPVQLHDYKLPFTFRVPRPLKMFDTEKYSTRGQDSVVSRKSKESKKNKTKDNKKTKKSRDTETIEIIQQPVIPVTLTEEEILMKKRQYILPLMEANEALGLLETHKETQTK